MGDEPYNAAERSHVKAAAKAARFAEKARLDVVHGIMDTKSGRAYMLSRLERCHIFESSFSSDLCTMAFREGERNVGLQDLADIMKSCPDMYVLMLRENDERNTGHDSARPPTNGAGASHTPDPGDTFDDAPGDSAID
jgi:hypothetical protein